MSAQPREPKIVWNLQLADGRRVAKILGRQRPTLANGGLKPGQKVDSGPYIDIKTAIVEANLPLRRAHFLRTAIDQGIFNPHSGHHRPTIEELAEWTGYSVRILYAWLARVTAASYRPMPLSAIRHLLLEFELRDQSTYDWDGLLARCR